MFELIIVGMYFWFLRSLRKRFGQAGDPVKTSYTVNCEKVGEGD